jgi:hypothetical protein
MTTAVSEEAEIRSLRLRVESLERKGRALESFIERKLAEHNEAIFQLRRDFNNHKHSKLAEPT